MLLLLTAAAILTHAAALAGVHRLRGDITAYAFQSPDAGEYVALGRGLAWHEQYAQFDARGNRLTGPDTWRTPGYPLFLAAIIKLAGDSPRTLLLAQQLIAVLSVPLLWLVLRRLAAPTWALLGALAWCIDPFRVYYSCWLLSETLFAFVLILACWLWLEFTGQGGPARSKMQNPESKIDDALLLGLLTGILVLIRPIAAPLPLLALVGVALARRRSDPQSAIRNPQSEAIAPRPSTPQASGPKPQASSLEPQARLLAVLACLLGTGLALGPWLFRIHTLTGHVALSQQSGASLAYHKVVDVVLWSEGRPRHRFDPVVAAEIRNRIDRQLHELWEQRIGPLTPRQRESLRWENLNFGKPLVEGLDPIIAPLVEELDPFIASELLWSVGLDMLAERPGALLKCFLVQGLLMLMFPLGLVLWPPASAGSAPLSMLLGGQGPLALLISAAIGGAYAALALWILLRLIHHAFIHRRVPPTTFARWPAGFFAFWPAAAMFVLSLPFEDPRFRLPLIPLFWIMAVANSPFSRQRRVLPSEPHA